MTKSKKAIKTSEVLQEYIKLIEEPLVIRGEIGIFNAEDTRRYLIKVLNLRKKLSKKEVVAIESKHCMVYITSSGGDAYEAFSIYDYLKLIKKEGIIVEIHCSGEVASAAVPLLILGDIRKSTVSTIFMIHSAAYFFSQGKSCDQKKITSIGSGLKIINKYLKKAFLENTKITTRQYNYLLQKYGDYYFTAERALELGIIDEIL